MSDHPVSPMHLPSSTAPRLWGGGGCRRRWWAVAAAALSACAHQQVTEGLQPAVDGYNQSLRWKRFEHAAGYLPPEERAGFLQTFLAAEDDLHIDEVQVRSVTLRPDSDPPAADVVVVAQTYLLPSTVLTKVVQVQTWQWRQGRWLLTARSGSLLPPGSRGVDSGEGLTRRHHRQRAAAPSAGYRAGEDDRGD